jgi:acetoacetyl-CoA synthetase
VYAVVDKLDYVDSTICVGQRRPGRDDDEKVLLFIKMQGGAKLTQEQKDDISQKIKVAYSARHVPHHIFQVKDIPVTNNLKKIELAVKRIVCGQLDFKPSSTTLNPECLEEYKQYHEIEKVVNRAKL